MLLFSAYSLGLAIANPTPAFATTLKIKITHTHKISAHSHHAHDEGHPHQDTENTSDTQHCHEIPIPTASPYTVGTSSVVIIVCLNPDVLFPSTYIEDAPEDRSLGSIFRPPIA